MLWLSSRRLSNNLAVFRRVKQKSIGLREKKNMFDGCCLKLTQSSCENLAPTKTTVAPATDLHSLESARIPFPSRQDP